MLIKDALFGALYPAALLSHTTTDTMTKTQSPMCVYQCKKEKEQKKGGYKSIGDLSFCDSLFKRLHAKRITMCLKNLNLFGAIHFDAI